MLRVVATFPLVANFNSNVKSVDRALQDDKHLLALLSLSALTAGCVMLTALKEALKSRGTNGVYDMHSSSVLSSM